MKTNFTHFLCVLIALTLPACKALKPSANLEDFADYFTARNLGNTAVEGIHVTFFGTSTLLIDDGETQLLIDGFFSRPPLGKVAFGRVRSNESVVKGVVEQYKINRLKAVFVCHSHYDHVMDAPLVCKLTNAQLYGSSSTLHVGTGAGLNPQQMRLFEPRNSYTFGQFTVTVIESKHTPPFKVLGKTNATDPKHPNITEALRQPVKADKYIEGGTFDFYVQHPAGNIMVKASTNYIEHALDDYKADVFFIGTAMLGKQDSSFKQAYYRNTVAATKAKTMVPIHWDNFLKPLRKPLTPLPYLGDNVAEGFAFLIQQANKDNIQFTLMQRGETLRIK